MTELDSILTVPSRSKSFLIYISVMLLEGGIWGLNYWWGCRCNSKCFFCFLSQFTYVKVAQISFNYFCHKNTFLEYFLIGCLVAAFVMFLRNCYSWEFHLRSLAFSWLYCLVRESIVNPKENSVLMTSVTAAALMLHHSFLPGASQLPDEEGIAILLLQRRKPSLRVVN